MILSTLNPKLEALLSDVDFLHESSQWSNARLQSEKRNPFQLANYHDPKLIREKFVVMTTGPCPRLLWRDTSEEVVLDVTGIIAWCLFPPVSTRKGLILYKNNPERTTQQIVLCGPQDDNFENALQAIKEIYQYYEESFPPNTFNDYKDSSATHHPSIYAGTRILSVDTDHPSPDANICDSIDPERILRNLQRAGHYRYTTDNEIHFNELISNKKGILERVQASPALFRQGHIVEISVVFKTTDNHRSRSFYIQLDSILLQSRKGAKLMADPIFYKSFWEQQQSVSTIGVKRPNKRRGEEDDATCVHLSKKQRRDDNDNNHMLM